MKYMLLFVNSSDGEMEKIPEAERNALYGRIGQWWEQHSKAGRLVEGHELQPARTATTVKFNIGKPVVTDGPFMEAKETVGGYGIVEAPDLDTAIQMAKTWPAQGKVEIRPVVEREGM